MGSVMIKCPNTDEPVQTGIAMNRTAFETATLVDNPLPDPCPRCGEIHTWSNGDAWMEEED